MTSILSKSKFLKLLSNLSLILNQKPGKGQKKTQNLVAVIYFQNMSQAVDKIKIPSLQVLKKK